MGKFHLAEQDVRWSGVDDTTPPGHCIASGLDPVGNLRVWLFASDEPSDDTYRGNILLPKSVGSAATAYGPTGAYVKSGFDSTELLQHLVEG